MLRLQFRRFDKHIADGHNANFAHDDAAVENIFSMFNDSDWGGRMVDNIVTNTLLPALSRQILNKVIARKEITEAQVEIKDGEFGYGVS